MADLFQVLDSLSYTKKDITRGDDESIIETYDPYVIMIGLSQHVDTILVVNELNKHPGVTKQMHYDYLFHSVRARKRTGKWAKQTRPDNIQLIMDHYGYSRVKAIEALKILTDDQIKEIKEIRNTGGRLK